MRTDSSHVLMTMVGISFFVLLMMLFVVGGSKRYFERIESQLSNLAISGHSNHQGMHDSLKQLKQICGPGQGTNVDTLE